MWYDQNGEQGLKGMTEWTTAALITRSIDKLMNKKINKKTFSFAVFQPQGTGQGSSLWRVKSNQTNLKNIKIKLAKRNKQKKGQGASCSEWRPQWKTQPKVDQSSAGFLIPSQRPSSAGPTQTDGWHENRLCGSITITRDRWPVNRPGPFVENKHDETGVWC